MMRVEVCPEHGPAMGYSASRWPSDDLAAVTVSRPPNFVAARLSAMENHSKRSGNLANIGIVLKL
jgi:thioester reductase-like protein